MKSVFIKGLRIVFQTFLFHIFIFIYNYFQFGILFWLFSSEIYWHLILEIAIKIQWLQHCVILLPLYSYDYIVICILQYLFVFYSYRVELIKNANKLIERVKPPAVCTLKSLFNLIVSTTTICPVTVIKIKNPLISFFINILFCHKPFSN